MKHFSFYSNRMLRGLISVLLALLFVAIPAQQAVLAICSPSATSGNDTITCDGADDTVDGLAGNDGLTGGGGNDVLNGGAGNDTLTGGAGNDVLVGGTGNDSYVFNTNSALGTDTVTEASGGGTDTLTFTGSNNAVTVNLGTTGNQTVNSNLTLNLTSAQVENVTGGNGNDTITGNTLNNSLSGGNGNDTLNGGAGNDTLTGGAGNDVLVGGTGNDSYVFNTNSALGTDTVTEASGGGTDTLTFTGSNNAVTVNLGTTGNQTVNSNLTLNLTSAQVENVTGGNGNDTITGNTLNNSLSGGNGNDTLNGDGGNDTLTGDSGNDTLSGGAGNDVLTGGTGDDTYVFNTNSALGADTLNEALGGGTDTLTFTGSTGDVVISLALPGNQTVNSNLTLNLTSAQVENVTGGDGNDTLTGNDLNNTLVGGNGNDTLDGGNGNDILNGGAGNDVLWTSAGLDTIDGGADDDEIVITGSHENGDSADGGTGVNIFRFYPGTAGILRLISNGEDTLDFSLFGTGITIDLSSTAQQSIGGGLLLTLNGWFKKVIGTGFDDNITGNDLDNNLNGGDGNDDLDGRGGDDVLTGGAGNDRLDGGDGTDSLDGGAGYDEVQNYSLQDVHTNIESGFPSPAPEGQTADVPSSVDKGYSPVVIQVEWGQQVDLPCTSNTVELVTREGHWIRLTGLCGYSIVLDAVDVSQLEDGIDSAVKPLSGVTFTLLQQGKVLGEIPSGGEVEITFAVPAGFEGNAYYTGNVPADGHTAWIEIPLVLIDDTHARIRLQAAGTYALLSR